MVLRTVVSPFNTIERVKKKRLKEKPRADVHTTKILKPRDPRMSSPEADAACSKEIEDLVRRGTWELVLKEDVPPGANLISGAFVIAMKHVEEDSPIFKARFVAMVIVTVKSSSCKRTRLELDRALYDSYATPT